MDGVGETKLHVRRKGLGSAGLEDGQHGDERRRTVTSTLPARIFSTGVTPVLAVDRRRTKPRQRTRPSRGRIFLTRTEVVVVTRRLHKL